MELAGLLHKLSDALRDAAREVDRGDDDGAATVIENAARDIRKELEEKAA